MYSIATYSHLCSCTHRTTYRCAMLLLAFVIVAELCESGNDKHQHRSKRHGRKTTNQYRIHSCNFLICNHPTIRSMRFKRRPHVNVPRNKNKAHDQGCGIVVSYPIVSRFSLARFTLFFPRVESFYGSPARLFFNEVVGF